MKYYPALKKELLPFVTAQTNSEDIILSEISQTHKGKYYTISLLCWSVKSWTHNDKEFNGAY